MSSFEYMFVYDCNDWSGDTTEGMEVCDLIGIVCSGEFMGILD
jgi:hypothetical protein